MAHWGFLPQEAFAETITADVAIAAVTPLADILERAGSELVRGFRLRYAMVSSEDCAAMAAFYTARRGPFESFDFTNPNDMRVYRVRFGSSMQLQYFQPQLFRHGQDVALTVVADVPAAAVTGGGGSGYGDDYGTSWGET